MISCFAMVLVLVFAGLTLADSAPAVPATGTDVTGTDVTGTDVPLYGNLDGNNRVDAADALIILKASVGKTELSGEQLVYADVYQDGKVDAADALYVLKYAVGKIDTLPVTGTDVTGTDVTNTDA